MKIFCLTAAIVLGFLLFFSPPSQNPEAAERPFCEKRVYVDLIKDCEFQTACRFVPVAEYRDRVRALQYQLGKKERLNDES